MLTIGILPILSLLHHSKLIARKLINLSSKAPTKMQTKKEAKSTRYRLTSEKDH